jgi:hypothetical protein
MTSPEKKPVTSVLKASTDIITNIPARPVLLAKILAIMSVSTFYNTSILFTVSTFEQVDVDSVGITDKTNTSFKTVCYYPVSNKFNKSATDPIPKDLNPMLCSHLIFIPTYIDQYNRVIPSVPSDVDLYQTAIPAMRKRNPKLIIMISNGGNISAVMQSVKNTSEYVFSVTQGYFSVKGDKAISKV